MFRDGGAGGGGLRAEEECHGILKEDVSADQQ